MASNEALHDNTLLHSISTLQGNYAKFLAFTIPFCWES